MWKRYSFWLWVAIVFQILTAAAHSLSLIVTPQYSNDTERQLLELMSSYKSDMGAGFHRSMQQLFTALSACFPILYIFGALNNIYLLRKRVETSLTRGFLLIEVIIFGVTLFVMLALTFLPPIVMSGLVFVLLLLAFLLVPRKV